MVLGTVTLLFVDFKKPAARLKKFRAFLREGPARMRGSGGQKED